MNNKLLNFNLFLTQSYCTPSDTWNIAQKSYGPLLRCIFIVLFALFEV